MIKKIENQPGAESKELVHLPEKRRTKIELVREKLQANSEVFVAGEIHEYDARAQGFSSFTETVDIIISPVKPLFDVDELNTFMDSLFDEKEVSSRDAARTYQEDGMELGKLYFNEVIGSVRTESVITVETTEPETLQRAGRETGKFERVIEDDLRRRTWVRVYPDPISASVMAEYLQGESDGSADADGRYAQAHFLLTGKQIEELKAQYANLDINANRLPTSK